MDATCKTEDLSQPAFSETVNGGTMCRKAARTGVRPEKVDISNGCKSHQSKSQSSVAKMTWMEEMKSMKLI
jgi:hypothetical protein